MFAHLSDISWNETGEEAVELKKVMKSRRSSRHRSRARAYLLGYQAAREDAFSLYVSDKDRGSLVTGTVTEVDVKAQPSSYLTRSMVTEGG